MGMIQVTASQLKQEAQRLQEMNRQLKLQADQLEAKEQSLGGMWEGQAKEAFHTAFLRDKQQMEEFYQLIIKYVQALQQIAVKYEQAEQRNTQIASSRSY